MNGEPRSTWRKALKDVCGILILACAVFVVAFCVAFVVESARVTEVTIFAAVASSGVALTLGFAHAVISRLCSWRGVRGWFLAVACVITLIAMAYAEENWRGRHAWHEFKVKWEAKGERFEIASIAPPPVPDEQNFAMSPLWVETICAPPWSEPERGRKWYGNKVDALGHTNFLERLSMPIEVQHEGGPELTNRLGNWQMAKRIDLGPLQDYYRKLSALTNAFPVSSQLQTPAETVVMALSKYDPVIAELRKASQLPFSRFPLGYGDPNPARMLLPHLMILRSCTTTLRLRAVAELHSGQTEKSVDDILLMLRLTDSVRSEPVLYLHLVRIEMLQLILQPVWEGLASHQWTEAQLTGLDSAIGKLDFLADYQLSMRSERIFAVGTLDYLRSDRSEIGGLLSGHEDEEHFLDSHYVFQVCLAQFGPGGWLERNKVAVCRMYFELFVPVMNCETRIVSPGAAARGLNVWKGARLTPHNWMTRLQLPDLLVFGLRFSYAQSATDMARIACALERYRRAHGEYPEALDDIVPQFIGKLPHDIIGGQPLHYRRSTNGKFALYSVGWNETDDGGQVVQTNNERPDFTRGDWVWQMPGK